jgi:hypothetical protein
VGPIICDCQQFDGGTLSKRRMSMVLGAEGFLEILNKAEVNVGAEVFESLTRM